MNLVIFYKAHNWCVFGHLLGLFKFDLRKTPFASCQRNQPWKPLKVTFSILSDSLCLLIIIRLCVWSPQKTACPGHYASRLLRLFIYVLIGVLLGLLLILLLHFLMFSDCRTLKNVNSLFIWGAHQMNPSFILKRKMLNVSRLTSSSQFVDFFACNCVKKSHQSSLGRRGCHQRSVPIEDKLWNWILVSRYY